ncbi:MAG: IPExxxVDY family protein [Bacteroidales bacterium]|nr:IPExxxVDY family protein [Bacteroidales bacterium]MBQ3845907.1 IPExxxVDY family protein [Bacteroidales bacterium]
MVKKKKKIVVEPFDDIKIIGICTHLEDFKLAWHINKLLNVNLVKYSDIVNEDGLEFSFYLYDGGENCNTYNLVEISNSEGRWVTFSPATDYLIVIRNFINEENLAKHLEKIKHIEGVQLAYIIDLDMNSKIDALLEDIEMHEIDIVTSMKK